MTGSRSFFVFTSDSFNLNKNLEEIVILNEQQTKKTVLTHLLRKPTWLYKNEIYVKSACIIRSGCEVPCMI